MGRIGCVGFGGPPTHIALLRDLCVDRKHWLDASEFEDAIAACNLLPGPASTQLAIFCAWSIAGPVGAVVGGAAFIVPGLVVILGLAAVFLAASPPLWVLGADAGAGAAVAAVALHAGTGLIPASWTRAHAHARWLAYAFAGGIAAATIGPWLVVVLLGCGAIELGLRRFGATGRLGMHASPVLLVAVAAVPVGGVLALVWVACKVGALAYGGGFVIIPLMRHDAVQHYHWMTNSQFLDAVALGQVTPGPVVQTVAVVGYAAAGIGGGLLAALVAFSPSFVFVLGGARHFQTLRENTAARAFLDGAGPAAIGAIIGVAIPLALALCQAWQFAVLAGAVLSLLVLRRSVVLTLLIAAIIGIVIAQLGAPLPWPQRGAPELPLHHPRERPGAGDQGHSDRDVRGRAFWDRSRRESSTTGSIAKRRSLGMRPPSVRTRLRALSERMPCLGACRRCTRPSGAPTDW